MIGSNTGMTYKCTPRLRYQQRAIITGLEYEQVLQQAWVCKETGEIKWEDVPVENEQ